MSDTIHIIRHADKPAGKHSVPGGVTEDGQPDHHSLIVKGWQRAGCWADYFVPTTADGADMKVFAAAQTGGGGDADDGSGEGSDSARPEETATPLARRLGKDKPDTKYTKGDETKVADAAVDEAKSVTVICWQHEAIPAIVNAVQPGTIPDGQEWPGDCFNGLVTLTRSGGGWQFGQASPLLLGGDTGALPFPNA